jgi:ribonuclease HI
MTSNGNTASVTKLKKHAGPGLLARARLFENEAYLDKISTDMATVTQPKTEAQKRWQENLRLEHEFLVSNIKRLKEIDMLDDSALVITHDDKRRKASDVVKDETTKKLVKGENTTPSSSNKPSISSHDYILYFDGASRNNPGEAGAGWIIFHADDRTVACYGFRYMGNGPTNNEAEYTALIDGLAATPLNCNRLTVHGDSTLVINQTTGVWDCKAKNLIPFNIKAKNLLSELSKRCTVKMNWIGRDLNKFADKLSNVAIEKRRTECVADMDVEMKLSEFNNI